MHAFRRGNRPEPAWYEVARSMKKNGIRQDEIARVVGITQSGVSRMLRRVEGEEPIVEAVVSDAEFIKPHVARAVRQVFNRKAVRDFIAAGGGAEARMTMLRKLGIGAPA